jgi:hypothetical protein
MPSASVQTTVSVKTGERRSIISAPDSSIMMDP